MNSITIKLPLPPKCLHPNADKPMSRGGVIGRNKAVRAYRSDCELLARAALGRNAPPRWERATGRAVFYFTLNRRHDQDNLNGWLKHGLDALADAGVIVNDFGLSMQPPEQYHGVPRFSEYVELTIMKFQE